jgi:hypothetical protein
MGISVARFGRQITLCYYLVVERNELDIGPGDVSKHQFDYM